MTVAKKSTSNINESATSGKNIEQSPSKLLESFDVVLAINFWTEADVGEARAIWDVGHYGKSLYLQNSESSN